jgi:hypothetical protein
MSENAMQEHGWNFLPDPNAKESRPAVGAIQNLEVIDIESSKKFKIKYKIVFWSILQEHRNQLMEQCLVMHNDIPISNIEMEEKVLVSGSPVVQKARIYFTHQVEESE